MNKVECFHSSLSSHRFDFDDLDHGVDELFREKSALKSDCTEQLTGPGDRIFLDLIYTPIPTEQIDSVKNSEIKGIFKPIITAEQSLTYKFTIYVQIPTNN